MDEEEKVKGDYRTKIQFLILELSRESLYFNPNYVIPYNIPGVKASFSSC